MAFAPDLHVFPGGRVDRTDHDPRLAARSTVDAEAAASRLGGNLEADDAIAAHIAALRELFEEAGLLLAEPAATPRDAVDLRDAVLDGTMTFADAVERLDARLRTDVLVPIGHWTTPPIMPRRFDTWFFAAALPEGHVELSFDRREVVAHRWLRPRDALDAMAAGEIDMWIPTSATLQQLEHASAIDEIRERIVFGPVAAPRVVGERPGLVRLVLSGAGAVPGRTVNAYLVGNRERVVVDPGDASDDAAEAIIEAAARDAGRLVGIALTQVDPAHAAGAEALALRLDLPILGGPGAGRDVGFDVRELTEGKPLPGDGGWTAMATPGPRPEHLAFVGRDGSVLVGDLIGDPAGHQMSVPVDGAAMARSLDRLNRERPNRLYPGHGEPIDGSGGQ
jgi:glyoxylase-like metal-dependent hydrolase (beta-lactamase superfamily II)